MLTIYTCNTNNSFIVRRFGQMEGMGIIYTSLQVVITYDLICCDVQSFIDKIFL